MPEVRITEHRRIYARISDLTDLWASKKIGPVLDGRPIVVSVCGWLGLSSFFPSISLKNSQLDSPTATVFLPWVCSIVFDYRRCLVVDHEPESTTNTIVAMIR